MSRKKAHEHLAKVDPVLKKLLEKFSHEHNSVLDRELITITDHSQYFHKLCLDIIGQQLSNKVASVIEARFEELFPGGSVTPESVHKIEPAQIRGAGLSWAKVAAIKDLALHIIEGRLDFSKFSTMSSEEIIESLIAVKGIGTWTAEMFLIFTLGYQDIFSVKDLGLKNAMLNLYGISGSRKEIEQQMGELSETWSPFRSYASLLLWKSLENAD